MVKDKNKTKEQLIKEVSELRLRVAELEKSEAERRRTEESLSEARERLGLSDRELEQRNRETNLFCQMGARLQSCETLDEAYAAIQRFGADLFPTMTGVLFMSADQQKNMKAVAAWGADLQSERLFPFGDCRALQAGQAHIVRSLVPGIRCKHINPSFSGDYLDAPVTASGEIMGLFHLESLNAGYDQKTEELALIVAEHLALSLSNLKLRETLSEESIRDPLTGLFNRRYMEESLAQELARAARAGYPVSLLKLAIDNFKSLTNVFGRDGGDFLLKELGSAIQSQVRRGDVSCRFGGDEFVLVLPNARPELAVKRAESLKGMANNLNLVFHGRSLGPVTLSIGVVAYPDHGANADELLLKADQTLDHVKTRGHDLVELAGSVSSKA
jgi:diguanylate cyclase (GGDEF)-like protein